jgi:hypothetical protein
LPATADGELGSSSIMTALHDLSAATLSDTFCARSRQDWLLVTAGKLVADFSPRLNSIDCSALPFDFGSEGLRYYLPVPHNKCVGSEFVRIFPCLGRPENIAVIALNRPVMHRERGARPCKLRNEVLKERLDLG